MLILSTTTSSCYLSTMEVRKWWVLLSYFLTRMLPSSQGSTKIYQPNTLDKLSSFSPFYKQYWHNINSAPNIPKIDSAIIKNSVDTNHKITKNEDENHELLPTKNVGVVNSNFDSKDASEVNSEVTTHLDTYFDDNAPMNVITPVHDEFKTKNLTLKRLRDYHSLFNNITSFKERFDPFKLKQGSQINSKGLHTEKVPENIHVVPKMPFTPENISILSVDKENIQSPLPSNVTLKDESDVTNEIEAESKDVDVEMKKFPQANPIQFSKTNPSADYEAILEKIRNFKAFSAHGDSAPVTYISTSNQIVAPDNQTLPHAALTSQTTTFQLNTSDDQSYIPEKTHNYHLGEILTKDDKSPPQVVAPIQSSIHTPLTAFKSFGKISPDIFYNLRQQLHSKLAKPKPAPNVEASIATISDSGTEKVATVEIVTNLSPQIVKESPSPSLPVKIEHNNPSTLIKEIEPLLPHIDHKAIPPEKKFNVPVTSEPLPNLIVTAPTVVQTPIDDQLDLSKQALKPTIPKYVDLPKNPLNNQNIGTVNNISSEELNKLLIVLNQLTATPVYKGKPNVNTITEPQNGNLVLKTNQFDPIIEIRQDPVKTDNLIVEPAKTIQSLIDNTHLPLLPELDQTKLSQIVAFNDHEIIPIEICKPNNLAVDNTEAIVTPEVNVPFICEESGIHNSPKPPESVYTPVHYPPTVAPKIINIDAILANFQNKQEKQLNQALQFLLLSDLLNKKICNPKIAKTLLTLLYLR